MDMYYGILSMQLDFFKLTIVLAGSLFLFCVIPNNNIADAVMTSLGIESVEALVYSFKIGIMLMPTFLIFIIWKALEISSIYLNKEIFNRPYSDRNNWTYQIIEIIMGSFYVATFLFTNKFLVMDKIIFYFVYFIIIKLVFKLITKVFHINTRHFGINGKVTNNDDYQHFAAVDKERI